jgi:UDP-2,4-diacetamido-2,4,6-trideoxy-beta-L-altropyranose hydrolase
MNIKVAIRVDVSAQIGTGHFVRCLTLADGLTQHGVQIRFVSRELPMHFRDMLAVKGIEFVLLTSDVALSPSDDLMHAHWLGTSQEQDAQDTIQALSDQLWDWLIVDHYALDTRWESVLRGSARQIMVIDDIADRRHECDVLLDQNFYADMQTRYAGKVPTHCKLLLGPRYALLRNEFRELRAQVAPRTGVVNRVLVFFGGIDANNYTGHVIEAMSMMDNPDLYVDVVIGVQHPCREQISAACAKYGFICHVQTDKMAALMAEADMGIGAGGTATWERCCLGLPTLAFCIADNQKKPLANAAGEGLLYSPEIKGDLNQAIQRHVAALVENDFLRQHLSRNGMQAVDGLGVLRVITSLGCSDIVIRRASVDDSENLFQWRNHPSIREVSRNTNSIDRQQHQSWFSSVLNNPEKMLLIGQRSNCPVGVVRFDKLDDEAEISIYIVPDKTSAGLGQSLLQSAEQWLRTNYPGIRTVRANVLGSNERSQRMFSGAGYQIESTYYTKKLH